MANYSIWILGESNLSFTGGVSLDGITQGDGSHLDGKFITINATAATEVFISDNGNDTNFADNDNNQSLNGDQIIDGVSYSDGTRIEAEFRFVLRDDSTGIDYTVVAVNVRNSSPAYATNEAVAFIGTPPPTGVSLRVVGTGEGPPNGGANAIDASEITPICFCRGTQIETSFGLKSVEDLGVDDQVCRPNGTSAPLRRIFSTKIDPTRLETAPRLRPIRLMAGSLGMGLPKRDLLVSRQHRILTSSKIAKRMFGREDVLVAANKLTKLPGIFVDTTANEVEYFHLLFDTHEIIFAEGVPTESLYTGPEALKAVGREAREEILTLFPDLADVNYRAEPARVIPTAKRQKTLVERHLKNEKALLS